jgi:hypothetical protein
MADVTEVIHKITYEVDDASLQNVTRTLQLQLTELGNLNRILTTYRNQLNSVNAADDALFNDLNRRIDDVNRKVEANTNKLRGVFQQVGNGLLKGLGLDGKLDDAVSKFTENFVSSLKKVDGFNVKSIGNLAKDVFSFTGVAPLAISLLVDLATGLINTGKAADTARTSYKEFLDMVKGNVKGTLRSIDERIAQVRLYAQTINGTYPAANKLGAASQLKADYPGIFKKYSTHDIASGKAGSAISELERQISAQERSQLYLKTSVDLEQKLSGAREAEAEALKRKKNATSTYEKLSNLNINGRLSGTRDNSYALRSAQKELSAADAAYETLVSIRKNIETGITYYAAEATKMANIARDLVYPLADTNEGGGYYRNSTGVRRSKPTKIRKESISAMQMRGNVPLTTNVTSSFLSAEEVNAMLERSQKERAEQQQKEEAEAAARRKQNTLDAISDYQTLAQSVADAYNTIVQVQINALDKEIAIREKRVEAAQKLAERGNVEALRMEEERLRQAQNMREQFARRQQIVNSAITVSNAIAAVARAALEGGGFGSAATIAALIAALAAGYAAVSSMSNDNAFADGVVDYKGKGGPRDDANWVRISSGESVITADGTKANRHILEAINSGAQFKLMNPALPYTMPMFRSPDGSGVYASAQDLGALEGKLDSVVNAIEDNRLRQNIYFNEHGVGIMTEKAMRRDRKRWM